MQIANTMAVIEAGGMESSCQLSVFSGLGETIECLKLATRWLKEPWRSLIEPSFLDL